MNSKLNLDATLIKHVIPAGCGIDDPDYQPENERTDRWYKQIMNQLNKLAAKDGIQSSLRKNAFRKGTQVKVLDVRDNLSNQDQYVMPNIPGIVADIEGANWDVEIVQSCVKLSDLNIGFSYDKDSSAESILSAFQKWNDSNTRLM